MTPYYSGNGINIYHGDALEVMRALPDASVDLIVADPPYYKVKESWWDHQWTTPTGFLEWLDSIVEQMARLLKPNGSLYLFASPKMSARVEVLISERLNVLNHLVWKKDVSRANQAEKEALRCFFGDSERIIFAEHYGSDGHAMHGAGYTQKCDELRGFVFEPLRAYLADEWERAGLTKKDADKATGTQMAGHWFTCIQWALPTEKHYNTLKETANKDGGDYLCRPYEELRLQYEELRRPFNLTAQKQFTDVWEFMPVLPYPGKHECEKPPALLHHILDVSTRPGAVVLDPFLGSGRSLEVAKDMGLQGIGIEIQEAWCRVAADRCAQYNLFTQAA